VSHHRNGSTAVTCSISYVVFSLYKLVIYVWLSLLLATVSHRFSVEFDYFYFYYNNSLSDTGLYFYGNQNLMLLVKYETS